MAKAAVFPGLFTFILPKRPTRRFFLVSMYEVDVLTTSRAHTV